MSEIVGFNFENQRMTPNAYGITLEKTFQDGILKGCSMAFSGTVFTISAGYLVVRGRQLNIPSAMEIAVDQALSGYARIVLTIDLSMTASEDSFEQVSVITEYSSTSGGFASLIQEDINISGTKYQVVLAMVSLGTGGITGIESQMPAVKLFNAPQSFTATILASGWTTENAAAGIYKQTVTVPGLLATDSPIVDIDMMSDSAAFEVKLSRLEAWANVYSAWATTNAINIRMSELPTIDIPIKMVVIRK